MSEPSKIELLNALGHMSDSLRKLNERARKARLRSERRATYAHSPAQRTVTAARWQAALDALRAEYERTVKFSQDNGLVTLPVPRELTQTP